MTKAREFAAAAHGKQMYGHVSYLSHLDEVYALSLLYGASPTVQTAAYLHDVLEDTPTTAEEVRKSFGSEVTSLVEAVTKLPKGPPRDERLAASWRKIRAAGTDAVFLKLLDRLANVRRSWRGSTYYKKYQSDHLLFRAILYTPGEHEALWAELESELHPLHPNG